MTEASALSRLAERMGILPAYHDFGGAERVTTDATRRALLTAMGLPVATENDAEDALAALDAAERARIAPPERILAPGLLSRIDLRRPAEWALHLEDEAAAAARGSATEGVDLPPLPMGVHRLAVAADGREETVWLIAAPRQAPSLSDVTGLHKVWGVTAALYGFRSRRNAGLGDYRDLGDMAAALGAKGAAFLGVNPVHAIGAAADRSMVSPYSPTHRGFLNPWHIALDGLQRYCGEAAPSQQPGRPSEGLVDYEGVAGNRERALRAAFESFLAQTDSHPARLAFDAFAASAGAELQDFATYEALSLRHGPDWRRWPVAFRDRRSAAVEAFAREAADEVRFHAWLQWVASDQLSGAQGAARRGGMAIGLYLDFAVGAVPGGAETWADPEGHILGATLAAPPDAFGDAIQGWSLAPLSPHGMARQGYRNVARLLRGSMRYAGAIRIDHALGLGRCFWAPDDGSPGGYVRYPTDALLAVIAIEAARAGVLVVGEDLGLVPAGFRERLAEAGLYGVDVLQFERGGDGGFPRPEDLRARSVASFGTHDTPTVAGFFSGRDLDWRVTLGHLDAARRDQAMAERHWLRGGYGETQDDWAPRIHERLAWSRSELVAVQLDDVTGEVEQQNLPGTVEGHPNWRRRAGVTVEEVGASAGIARVAHQMRVAGRAASKDESPC